MESLNVCVNTSNSSLLNFSNLTVELLETIFERQKSLTIELNDRVALLDKSTLTYYDCFEYNMKEESQYSTIFSLIDFEQLHPDKEIRTKSVELNKDLSTFGIEQSMREDVFEKISYYYSNQFNEEKDSLTPEQIRYVEKTMIGYEMLGLGLGGESKEKVKEINKQLSIYSSDYNKNLGEVNTEYKFDAFQLKGMDEDWLSNRLIDGTDKYTVKLQYPDYIPIMEYCNVRETRKFMAEAMGSRCMETNLPILLDAIKLRKEKANLFGFNSHTDFKLQNMMAKNSPTVMGFLNQLVDMIKPIVKTDKEKLSILAMELDGLETIESYDKGYYTRIYTERVSGLNMSDLKKMFSIESVTNGIFNIYQELLGLKFVDITESNPQALYANDIKLFCVYDEEDKEFANPMGYFYLDLFPREGKYGHAAMFTFIRSSQYNLPVSAIVCNFDPKLNVEFDNVVTYFHEFGHLMHNMVSKVSISSLSGTACQIDFVETPSQMFEEWCYCEEPLKRLVMPEFVNLVNEELVKKINKQNKQLQGMFNAGQLSYGLLDQAIHSESIPNDTWVYYNNLIKELFDWETSPKTNMLANWGHMFGYDSSYYGYLWSKVYAIDLFSFFKSDPMNKELGMRLREKILSKGGSLDGLDLLRNFMEREPNPDAYIQWLSE
jgi:Zn-dependent oligopeptidase